MSAFSGNPSRIRTRAPCRSMTTKPSLVPQTLRAGALRRDLEVGRKAAVRIDFLRRKCKDLTLDVGIAEAGEHTKKESRVGHGLFDLRIGRHDEEHRRLLRGDGRMERRGWERQPGKSRRSATKARAGGGRF